jgi:hypothetical protein
MRPIKQLPAHYYEHATLDLAQNRWAAVILNLLGIPLLLGWGWLFVRLAQLLSPAFRTMLATGDFTLSIANLLLWLGAILGVIILHELVHGFFLWLITQERPVFGYSWYYAYAGAPDWYLPRAPYIIVALAPLVAISLVGVALLPFVPGTAVIVLLLALITNAAGAVGDIFVTIWVLWQPTDVLIRDTGPAFTLYRQESDKPA